MYVGIKTITLWLYDQGKPTLRSREVSPKRLDHFLKKAVHTRTSRPQSVNPKRLENIFSTKVITPVRQTCKM